MGGFGSGNRIRFGSKETAESSLPLDVRELKRQGLLKPGGWINSKWSRNGNVQASIGATVHEDRLVLRYTFRKTEDIEQPVRFTWTPCNFGGQRIWFVCPHCHRRCALIYPYGKYFACRICANIAYQSQNETSRDRLFSKANELRKKIGAHPGAANPLPIFKPKNMHHSAWVRIRRRIEILEDCINADLARIFGL